MQQNGQAKPPIPVVDSHIDIVLHAQPGGGYQPELRMYQVRGGWKTAHEALCISLNRVAAKMVEEAQAGQKPLITVATEVPRRERG